MKYVRKVQTADGRVFDKHQQATEHLEKLYKARLDSLVDEFAVTSLKLSIRHLIEDRLESFMLLKAIKEDMIMENTEDEPETLENPIYGV